MQLPFELLYFLDAQFHTKKSNEACVKRGVYESQGALGSACNGAPQTARIGMEAKCQSIYIVLSARLTQSCKELLILLLFKILYTL